jgi:hypothetical protein
LATLANIQPSKSKLCVTPLAGPVEPEVKKMAAGGRGIDRGQRERGRLRVANGEKLAEEEKQAGHAACQRALAQTSSVTQKYQLQEADFDIVGRPPKPAD